MFIIYVLDTNYPCGPNNPKSKIDVYLQPLIDDLNMLWDVGVRTYDISLKENFQNEGWTYVDHK